METTLTDINMQDIFSVNGQGFFPRMSSGVLAYMLYWLDDPAVDRACVSELSVCSICRGNGLHLWRNPDICVNYSHSHPTSSHWESNLGHSGNPVLYLLS